MSDFTIDFADALEDFQDALGEPVVYQPATSGISTATPFTVTAIRHGRVREESGAQANFEEISVNQADFAVPPAKGDWVTAWGFQYTVINTGQAFAYGFMRLSLQQRAGQVLP